jgi:long-chain acyl-CoA synthetase
MIQRNWFQEYPSGMPKDVNYSAFPSVVALMEDSFARYGEASAYCLGPKSLNYAALDHLSRDLAAFFQSKGLQRNDRVAVMLPNLLHYPVTIAAVLRAGLIAVNVNPLYTPRELEHQLRDSGAKAIVMFAPIHAVMANTLDSIFESVGLSTVVLADASDALTHCALPEEGAADHEGPMTFDAALAFGRLAKWERPLLEPEDIAVLQYTGGTTGVSKGASLSHRALVANVLSSEVWLQPGLQRRQITGQMNIVCALPLYHVFAFVSCALLGMRTGAQVLLVPNARDLSGTIALLRPHKIHVIPAVNTLFNGLSSHPDFGTLDFSELCVSNGGGTAVMPAVAQRWLALTGCPIVEGYGLSETASGVTCNRADSDAFTGTIGLPMPGVDVRIIDEQDVDVAVGLPGEIAIRGPQLMSGYWGRPDETAQVMTRDGYLKSGDVGVIDERGYIRIVDRKKDLVLVSGFNVYPSEIEAVVSSHPQVADCAAVGVPDSDTGEAVHLFVVPRDPRLTLDDLRAFCAQQLTGYKRPKYIEIRQELPKTPVGKVLRRELRAEVTARNAPSQA